MNTIRPCGCKGRRTCLQCEKDYNIEKPVLQQQFQQLQSFSYCPKCQLLYGGWNTTEICAQHPNHNATTGIELPGIYVQENFLSNEEAMVLMRNLDSLPWAISQSGRRKQNFGPKTNFKKRKLQLGSFNGFPDFSRYIQEKFKTTKLLEDFQTIEQCSLEYDSLKGACIDPHVDDCWIWGERVVTVNCLGDSVLTLTLNETGNLKYNLDVVPEYERKLLSPLLSSKDLEVFKNCVIRVPMPNLSLIVLFGPARYQFEHSVLREDIKGRRVCIAYREFTPIYIDGGTDSEKGREVTKHAQHFWTLEEAA